MKNMQNAILTNNKGLLISLLGGVAIFATFMAQTSSGLCAFLSFEQPKMPKSLIKMD